ncbi:MAG: bifunctional oligoribonuclease/PAP phosphatase NrnA [Thermoanaerobaculales bacterium]
MTTATGSAKEALKKLRAAGRILITCHRNPDGDAIGSALALADLAEESGVDAVIVNRDPTPENLKLLPGAGRIVIGDTLPEDFPEAFDMVVTVECPGLDRTGFEDLTRLPILNIDHHPANPAYGAVNFLDEESPAVGEMVWRMFVEAGILPSADTATNLLVALTTDTGDFRYSNATGRAFRAGAEMVDAGADPTLVADWVHGNRSLASARLMGEALQSLTLHCDGRLAVIAVDQESFRRAQAGPEDTEEIVTIPRAIAGVQAVAFFKQWEPGIVRVSLRSRGDVDVRCIAAAFGGGGHRNAAGCAVTGDLPEVKAKVSAAVADILGGGD